MLCSEHYDLVNILNIGGKDMKTGDHVKVVNTDYKSPELANGQEGVVLEAFVTHEGQKAVRVAMDNGWTPRDANPLGSVIAEINGCPCDGWHFFIEELEVIQKEA
jgi:hypothetical protein